MASMDDLIAAMDRLVTAADRASLAINRLVGSAPDSARVAALIGQVNGAVETLEAALSAVPPETTNTSGD